MEYQIETDYMAYRRDVNSSMNWFYGSSLIQQFFLSKNLTLPRGPDGRHPDGQGYKIWMDSIATWLHTKAKWKINMVKPTKMVYKRGFKLRTLNAGRRANKNVNQEVDSTKLEITSDSTAY